MEVTLIKGGSETITALISDTFPKQLSNSQFVFCRLTTASFEVVTSIKIKIKNSVGKENTKALLRKT